jgi:hypothetical protein
LFSWLIHSQMHKDKFDAESPWILFSKFETILFRGLSYWLNSLDCDISWIYLEFHSQLAVNKRLTVGRKPVCGTSQIDWSGVRNQQIARTKSVPNICQIGIQGYWNQRSTSSRRANQSIWANAPLQCV